MTSGTVLRRVAPAVAVAGSAVGLWRAKTPRYDPTALAAAEGALLAHLSPRATHRFVQSGSHQLHTLIVGQGPPLVLLHGHGGGVGVWHRNLSELARHFRVYAIDWLGWGRSDRPPFPGRSGEDARRWWVESIEAWRQAVGLESFYLLGHSLGGWGAGAYPLAYPHRVRPLGLENAAGLVDQVNPRKAMLYVISPQRIVRAIGPLGYPLVVRNRAVELSENDTVREALADYYYHLSMAPLSGQYAFQAVLRPRSWSLPLAPRADRLTMPTTIFWGLNDSLLTVLHAHQLEMRLPYGDMILFPEASHNPHSEATAQFHDAMRRIRYGRAPHLMPLT